jgi:glycosyltransferase involved in cell wall biosynthesis
MDYYANVDGVQWFAREVFPAIRARVPNAIFVIVGSNPNAAVRALERQQGVVVTGRVPDVRPYLAHAGVVVAPLRLARGVQNKVLEALAMDRPVVATPNALQGIQFAERAGVDIASIPSDMASAVLCRIRSCREGARGRAFIDAHYGWPAHLSGVMDLFGRQAFSARSIGAG